MIRVLEVRAGLSSPGNRGRSYPCRSWRLAVKRGSTRFTLQGAWKLPSAAKAVLAVIRESSGHEGARGVGRLQTLGRRIFPVAARRAERRAESAAR